MRFHAQFITRQIQIIVAEESQRTIQSAHFRWREIICDAFGIDSLMPLRGTVLGPTCGARRCTLSAPRPPSPRATACPRAPRFRRGFLAVRCGGAGQSEGVGLEASAMCHRGIHQEGWLLCHGPVGLPETLPCCVRSDILASFQLCYPNVFFGVCDMILSVFFWIKSTRIADYKATF